MEDAFAADIAVRAQVVDRSVQCEASGAAAFLYSVSAREFRTSLIVDRVRASHDADLLDLFVLVLLAPVEQDDRRVDVQPRIVDAPDALAAAMRAGQAEVVHGLPDTNVAADCTGDSAAPRLT